MYMMYGAVLIVVLEAVCGCLYAVCTGGEHRRFEDGEWGEGEPNGTRLSDFSDIESDYQVTERIQDGAAQRVIRNIECPDEADVTIFIFDADEFTVVEELGAGTYGTVYQAVTNSGYEFALKRLHKSDDFLKSCEAYSQMEK